MKHHIITIPWILIQRAWWGVDNCRKRNELGKKIRKTTYFAFLFSVFSLLLCKESLSFLFFFVKRTFTLSWIPCFTRCRLFFFRKRKLQSTGAPNYVFRKEELMSQWQDRCFLWSYFSCHFKLFFSWQRCRVMALNLFKDTRSYSCALAMLLDKFVVILLLNVIVHCFTRYMSN
jgi:hypothetical protein